MALTYDYLPEGSDLRRAFDGRGGVTITAPAGELSPTVRRAAGRAGLAAASVACAGSLLIGAWLIRSGQVDPSLRVAAVLSLGVLAGAIFLLVWWVLFSSRTYVLSDLRRQSTVLHADASRLLVETSGPLGDCSVRIAAADILAVEVAAQQLGGPASAVSVLSLRLRTRSENDISLLPAHHPAELRWVAATVTAVTGVET